MNWDIFSPIGYVSVALWLSMPLVWLLHLLMRQRGWLVHLALLLGVGAYVAAKVNSETYVNQIQVDRSQQIQEQLDRQELAQQAATAAREEEVAQIRFAEDAEEDFLDKAGMDESDLKYLQSFDQNAVPEWKQAKRPRGGEVEDDSLEAQIGAIQDQEGVETAAVIEDEPREPILMSDRDKLAADRLDAANLTMIRVMLSLGVVVVVVDYLRRANRYDSAYFPLPLPSRWVDAMSPRKTVDVRAHAPRRALLDELRVFARRGESFVYVTEDQERASQATATVFRLPLQQGPVEVVNVANFNGQMNDDFVFETLWYGRNSFVVQSAERGEAMLMRFMELMAERSTTRAHVKQTVHIVWDVKTPITAEVRQRFAKLATATGFSLLLCQEENEQVA